MNTGCLSNLDKLSFEEKKVWNVGHLVQVDETEIELPGVRQIARESGRIFPGTKAEAEILDQVRRQEEVLAKVSFTSSLE